MRTTLRIDDDVLQVARRLARSTGRTVGEVISELARRGLESASQEAAEEGVPRFSVSLDAKPITVEVVRSALDDP